MLTSLFLTIVDASAITLRVPDGRHSIRTWSLASSPCSVIHFLGKLTIYVDPPVN